ncbi:hypothetical protein RUM43_003935 [Polyplax serrata]|uniref:Uncharacterized protein n=1 Tax=Polyplax serrata TaxID=468196 RepID=A0AAN8S655_POLSC
MVKYPEIITFPACFFFFSTLFKAYLPVCMLLPAFFDFRGNPTENEVVRKAAFREVWPGPSKQWLDARVVQAGEATGQTPRRKSDPRLEKLRKKNK